MHPRRSESFAQRPESPPDHPFGSVLLTPTETATRIGIDKATLYRYWRRGIGPPFVQVSPRVRRCTVEAVDAFKIHLNDPLASVRNRLLGSFSLATESAPPSCQPT